MRASSVIVKMYRRGSRWLRGTGSSQFAQCRHCSPFIYDAVEIRLPWLTEPFAAANLNNEYAARAHGGGFISKPHHKERETKSNITVENPRNDRATRLARWL